jgi:hypothetical protein
VNQLTVPPDLITGGGVFVWRGFNANPIGRVLCDAGAVERCAAVHQQSRPPMDRRSVTARSA